MMNKLSPALLKVVETNVFQRLQELINDGDYLSNDERYYYLNPPEGAIPMAMRGCRYRCKFCIVPQKEGKPKPFNTIKEIWTNKKSDFIILLDNDFFGNPFWKDRIKEIREFDLRVNFSQGINIRIIKDEEAQALASVKFRNIKGDDKHPMIHFAWDRAFDEKLIDEGINKVFNAGIKPYECTFYILIGFDSTPEQDMYRVMKIHNYGCNPFVMPYNKNDSYQRKFARWVNHKAIFKSVDWKEYI